MASGRSIRFKILTLLVVPLLSLVGLWGFAASTTTGEALNLLKVDTIWSGVIDYSDAVVVELQKERLASAERVAAGDAVGSAGSGQLTKLRSATDKARTALAEQAANEDIQSTLTPPMRTQLTITLAQMDLLPTIRKRVDDAALTPSRLITDYSAISDAVHRLYGMFALSTDVTLYRQANGLIAAEQARELLSREQALIMAAGGKPGAGDLELLARIDGARTMLLDKARNDLDAELRSGIDQVVGSTGYLAMQGDIAAVLSKSPSAPTPAEWRVSTDKAVSSYAEALGTTAELLLARMEPAGVSILARAGVAGVLGLIAVIFSIFISIRVGGGIGKELAGLRGTARELAEVRLPRVVSRLRRGESVDVLAEAPPIVVPQGATSEIRDLATAFDSVQHTAVDAAVEQARLREGVSNALRNLARRSQSLLQRQLKLLDSMQSQADDPEALENLFRLDHLTTRMRRHAEGLVLLSGGTSGRKWRGTIPVEDVLSGAAAQVEDYPRVRVYPMRECGVAGTAVADLMHLFAELIENATSFSSPGNEVSVRGELVGRGFAVEIEDRGLGFCPDQREAINARLASPPEFDPAQTERLGFAVVSLLAARHGIGVTLKPSPFGGTTAIVLIPSALIEALPVLVDALPPEPPELVSVSVFREPPATGMLPRRSRSGRSRHAAELTSRAYEQTEPQPIHGLRSEPQPLLDPPDEPVVVTGAFADPAPVSAGLPRRVRQANLPDRLKQPPSPPPPAPPTEERSPEEARALLSSLQSGWQRGRQDSEQDGDPTS